MQASCGARMHREGLIHHGIELSIRGTRHRIDFQALTAKNVMVYGQTEVTRDLMDARQAAGAPTVFEAQTVMPIGYDTAHPVVRYTANGETREIACDFIAGCDGFHGVSRQSVPESALTILERLQDLPGATVDLRVEAGFQLGDLLATNGRPPEFTRAEAVWWTLVTTYLLDDTQAGKLGPKGRYWLARALLRLGDLRRERGDLEEARNAYDLVLRKNLPFAKLAREMLVRAGGAAADKPQPQS